MRLTDYGPVPVSRIKAESSRIFAALQDGHRVLISRRGDVVAAIEPPTDEHQGELAAYALPGPQAFMTLTATEISQGSPSKAIHAAEGGAMAYVTKKDKVYGILRPISPTELARENLTVAQVRRRQRLLSDLLDQNPEPSPDDFTAYTERATREVLGEDADDAAIGGPAAEDDLEERLRNLAMTVAALRTSILTTLPGTLAAKHYALVPDMVESVLAELQTVKADNAAEAAG